MGLIFLLSKDPVWVLFPDSDGTKELILTLLFLFAMFWLVLFSRRSRLPLFIVYICALLYFTILCRSQRGERVILNGLFDTVRNSLSFEGGLHVTDRITFNAMLLNILLFVPMGYILPNFGGIFKKAYLMIPMGLLLSLVIETIQYFTRLGVFDVDDLMFNTLGTALGYLLYLLMMRLAKMREEGPENVEKNGNIL